MYHSTVVQRRLNEAQQELQPEFARLGFPRHAISYHSVDEVDQFDKYLRDNQKYLYDSHGSPESVQNLDALDSLWILNERALVQCDHGYAMTRYMWVKDEQNLIRHFSFRVAQKILFSIMADLELEGASIEIMTLKARQLGMSTVVELLIALRIFFGYGVNAVVASADQEKSGLMANMLFMAYEMLPVWLRPRYTARSTEGDQKKLVFGSLNTVLSIQHGSKMKGGIAQGWTPTIYHVSECAMLANAETQIDGGLFKAVHASPSVFGVLESTGAGDIGWWPDTWRFSKANWGDRTCRLCPLFLPWFVGRDIYPTKTWIKMRPVPDTFYDRRLPETREHVAKARIYVRSHPLLSQYLGANWEMPIEQQYFWEVGYAEAKSKGKEGVWYQEMAGDDVEALQRSAESVFGVETIQEVKEKRISDYKVYGISGQSIEEKHEPDPDMIDYTQPRIPLGFRCPKDGTTYRWDLIPLRHDHAYVEDLYVRNPDAFNDYADGKVLIFQTPAAGVSYSMGVDTSNGRGHDWTAISMSAIGRQGMPDMQVAEFRSRYVNHVEAWAFAMAMATYYARFADGPQNFPFIGIEQLEAVGDTCQQQMRRIGYPASRFFRMARYDSVKLKAPTTKMGWFSTSWSRPLLTDGFVHSLRNNWYQLNSLWTIYECEHYEVHYTSRGKEKKEHANYSNDDGIMATAISTFIAHDTDTMAERSKQQYHSVDSRVLPPIDVRPYGNSVSTKQSNVIQSLEDMVYQSTNDLERYR